MLFAVLLLTAMLVPLMATLPAMATGLAAVSVTVPAVAARLTLPVERSVTPEPSVREPVVAVTVTVPVPVLMALVRRRLFGSVTVTDPKSLLLTNAINTGTGTVTVTATTGSLTLGSGVTLLSTGNVSLAATAGTVTDTAASPVAIAGNVAISGTSIAVNNNTANSMGAVSLTSSGAIAYTEGQTVNIGLISATSTAAAAVNIQSVSGNIIQTGTITIPAAYTAANFSAPTGAVTLTNVGNAIASAVPVGITANGAGSTGNTSLTNSNSLLLGNVQVVGGTFTVTTVPGASAGSITQATGTSIFEYGAASFNTKGGAVTLFNSGNNFGGLTINPTNTAAAGANVKVRETGTNRSEEHTSEL